MATNIKIGCENNGCGGQFVQLSITDETTTVQSLRAAVLNTLSVESSFRSGSSFEDTNTFKLTAVATNIMSSEGDSAQVFASVQTSDNAHATATKTELNVTSSVLKVSDTQLTVPVGAAKNEGCALVKASWWSCGAEIASTNPYVFVNMPAVTRVDMEFVDEITTIYFTSDQITHNIILQLNIKFSITDL